MRRNLSTPLWTLILALTVVLTLGLAGRTTAPAAADSLFGPSPLLLSDDEEEDDFEDDEDEEEDEDFDDEEDEEFNGEGREDFERFERELHIERAEAETRVARLEMVNRVAEIASNEVSAAAFALMHFEELFDEPEDGIEFLNDTLQYTKNDAVRRLVRIKLAELYMETDQQDQARSQLRKLLSDE